MAAKRTTVELIENNGPNTLLATFRALVGPKSIVDVQVAFVSASGMGTLLPTLRRAASLGRVRVITGLYQGVTEPAALRLLLKAQQQTKGRIETRLAKDPQFHRKLYVLRTSDVCHIISGSSNLTKEELKSPGEFNLLVRLPTSAPQIRRLLLQFDQRWSKGTAPLSLKLIKRYESIRTKRPHQQTSKKSIADLLGRDLSAPKNKSETPSDMSVHYWREYIDGFTPERTDNIISEETNWDQKRYDWFASWGDKFQCEDRILLFDRAFGWATLVVVKDTTRVSVSTPTGRHFVAFIPERRRSRRRLKPSLWKVLKEVGFRWSADERQKRRQLTESQWSRIESVFRK